MPRSHCPPSGILTPHSLWNIILCTCLVTGPSGTNPGLTMWPKSGQWKHCLPLPLNWFWQDNQSDLSQASQKARPRNVARTTGNNWKGPPISADIAHLVKPVVTSSYLYHQREEPWSHHPRCWVCHLSSCEPVKFPWGLRQKVVFFLFNVWKKKFQCGGQHQSIGSGCWSSLLRTIRLHPGSVEKILTILP